MLDDNPKMYSFIVKTTSYVSITIRDTVRFYTHFEA